ncbi:hypothetical protein [Enterovibrio nigricans]|uniref:Uncharacterized protein n=1 Tax=Enterovibrio nigricans DSM 22720 TaxID=1121868 RepID=A0A1T4VDG8_9GAMM|nr:hypothetical protein [Enterovibrio nigricans]PKF49898.1 hypothetical protein AT251_15455 [Enterovibrio nigricans]SKA63029.1 hypothetical protein SAMN02745132_03693 [Enterovibrio nigricans DSM 22720]
MDSKQYLYRTFFAAQDRFNEKYTPFGFEPDIVQQYLHAGFNLASFHDFGAENESPLLTELYLKQLYNNLLDAIQDPKRSRHFRHVCLDAIHAPLISLKRYYKNWPNGEVRFLQLQQELQRLQTPLD